MSKAQFLLLTLASFGFSSAAAQESETTKELKTFKDCDICPEMVVLPAGEVELGAYPHEAYRRSFDRQRSKAKIAKPFAMAKTETTLAMFRQFMAETNLEQPPMVYQGKTFEGCNYFDGKTYGFVTNHNWDNPGYPQREDEPVVCVSWTDATAFAAWVSQKAGRTYRIPSSVEFEYAFRAGAATPWSWGNDPSKACEHGNIADRTFGDAYPARSTFGCDDGFTFPAAVAVYKANAFGLHDMLGNVWEWTNDCWHVDLSNAPVDGSSYLKEDDGDCSVRVPKGGGWTSSPAWARAAARSPDGHQYRSFMLGFRLAADFDPKAE